MSKPITATAVLMLKEEGKLSLDDPIAKYVPELAELKTADGKTPRITLRHLLTHTSGMGEATDEEAKAARTLSDLVPAFASKPLAFEPGSKWKYCQSGILTLGRIVEIVSGVPLEVFTPTGDQNNPRCAAAFVFCVAFVSVTIFGAGGIVIVG